MDFFFSLNDKTMYLSCKICEGYCTDYIEGIAYVVHYIVVSYISQTDRNIITCWGELNNPTHDSESVKHLKNNPVKAMGYCY